MNISKWRNMFVATQRFLSDIIEEYGHIPVSSTDEGTLTSESPVLKDRSSHPFFT